MMITMTIMMIYNDDSYQPPESAIGIEGRRRKGRGQDGHHVRNRYTAMVIIVIVIIITIVKIIIVREKKIADGHHDRSR